MKNLVWIVKTVWKYLAAEMILYSAIGLLLAFFLPLQLMLYENIITHIGLFALNKAFIAGAILCCAIICNDLLARADMLIRMKAEHKACLKFTDDILKYIYSRDIIFLDHYDNLLLIEKAKNCSDNIVVPFAFQLIDFFQLLITMTTLFAMIYDKSKIAAIMFVLMSIMQNVYVLKSASESSEVNKKAFKKRHEINYVTSLFFNRNSLYEIKFFNLTKWFLDKQKRTFKDLRLILLKHSSKWTIINVLWSALMFLAKGFVLLVLALGYISAKISIPTIMFLIQSQLTFITTVTQLIATFSDLIRQRDDFLSLKEVSKTNNQINENINENSTICTQNHLNDLCCSNIAVSSQNISFYYSDVQALQDITFHIQKIQHVAIVGENGSGKSTLAKVILGLITSYTGSLYVNTRNFSASFQDFGEFYFSVSDCIKMREEPIELEKFHELLEQFEDLNFVNKLPDGLDTILGSEFDSNGTIFSGGEWQKLCIFRALYKNADIYVFDEPTSKVDPISQISIHTKISDLLKEHTVLTITHRIGLAAKADVIFYMHEGKIVESGTHSDLINYNGYYKALYNAQFGDENRCIVI